MRMWMVEPKIMCMKHLLGEHVELHMFHGTLKKGGNINGYVLKGLVEPFSIPRRHIELVREMERRGYKHKTALEMESNTLEYLSNQYKTAKVNVETSRKELVTRCLECQKLSEVFEMSKKSSVKAEPQKLVAVQESVLNMRPDIELKHDLIRQIEAVDKKDKEKVNFLYMNLALVEARIKSDINKQVVEKTKKVAEKVKVEPIIIEKPTTKVTKVGSSEYFIECIVCGANKKTRKDRNERLAQVYGENYRSMYKCRKCKKEAFNTQKKQQTI